MQRPLPLRRQGSVQARLNAFLSDASATARGECLASETSAGSGFVWQQNDNVSFVSDGHLSMVLVGETQGLVQDAESDGLTGAEVRPRRAWVGSARRQRAFRALRSQGETLSPLSASCLHPGQPQRGGSPTRGALSPLSSPVLVTALCHVSC